MASLARQCRAAPVVSRGVSLISQRRDHTVGHLMCGTPAAEVGRNLASGGGDFDRVHHPPLFSAQAEVVKLHHKTSLGIQHRAFADKPTAQRWRDFWKCVLAA